MKKKLLSVLLAVCLLFSLAVPTMAFGADEELQVTQTFASANGWNNNANWIGFKLNRALDLGQEGADVALYYEYVEDGAIKQMRSETEAGLGMAYGKNKLWSGYLVTNDGSGDVKYGSGYENDTRYSNILPANTLIMSNLTGVAAKFPKLTAKIQSGEVQYFRVRLVVNDETGKLVNDSYTNWIQYTADLTDSTPRGLSVQEGYSDPFAASLPNTKVTASIGDKAYPTLDAAVLAAGEGDTITLSEGVFEIYNAINVDKALTITGAGKDATTVVFNSEYNNPAGIEYFEGRTIYPIINASAPLTMQGLTVKGPTARHHGLDGIYATDTLALSSMAVTDIRCTADGADICGDQYGRSVLAKGSAKVTLDKVDLLRFQKQAIDVKDVAELSVTDSTVQGYGDQKIIGQNGIVLRDSNAVLNGNSFSDMVYSAENEWTHCSIAVMLLGNSTAALTDNAISDTDYAYYGDAGSKITFFGGNTVQNATEFEETSEATLLYPALSVDLDQTEAALEPGKTATLVATVTPENTTDTVVWSTSDDTVATVENGVITAVGVGSATITATAGDKTATCTVTVTAPEPEISVTPSEDAPKVDIAEEDNATLVDSVDDETKEAVENGASLVVNVQIDNIPEEEIPEEEAAKIAELIGEQQEVALYLDISLLAKLTTVDGDTSEKAITNTTEKLTFTIDIPEELQKDGREFVVIRVHNGVAEALETVVSEDGKTATFSTDRFSTYALAFEDPDVEAPSQPANVKADATGVKSVTLSWDASTDAVGVKEYKVYQGSELAATVTGTTATIEGLTPGTAYSFTVTALDAAGNESAASAALAVTTVALGDKEDLEALLAEVPADLTGYTEQSAKALTDAAKVAKDVMDDPDATQDDVDTALKALQDAIDGLEEITPPVVVDKTALEALLAKVPADLAGYTEQSAKALTDAAKAAKDVMDAPNATQDDVDAALKTLQDAIDGLKKADVTKPDPSPTPSTGGALPVVAVIICLLAAALTVVLSLKRKAAAQKQ